MSQQDNFGSGFFLGTLVGGVIGGVVGVLVASRIKQSDETPETFELPKREATTSRFVGEPSEAQMEAARRGLEDKIAQLNEAIDDVRQQLGNANGRPQEPPFDPAASLEN